MKTTVNHPAIGQKITDQPAIYVGTYAKYNNGSIAGEWVDMTQIADKEDFSALCAAIHSDEKDPEFMFQDWQSIPAALIGESWLSDDWFDVAQLDEDDSDAFAAYCKGASDTDIERFREAYAGQFESDEAFAEDMAEQCGMILKNVAWPYTCIDWEYAARELMYDYFEVDGYYFRSL